MRPSDGAKTLRSVCGEIRELTGLMRSFLSESSSSEVPDVFDGAADLISSVFTIGLDADAPQSFQLGASFDALVCERERTFLSRTRAVMASMSTALNELDVRIRRSEANAEVVLSALQSKNDRILRRLDSEHDAKLCVLKSKLAERRRAADEQQRGAFTDFEHRLARRLSAVSEEWNGRLSEADEQIDGYQKELHQIVHSKHAQAIGDRESLAAENRRMGAEHERISRDYKERTKAAVRSIEVLRSKLDTLLETLRQDASSADGKLKRLQDAFMNERRVIEQQRAAALADLDAEIASLEVDSEKAAEQLAGMPEATEEQKQIMNSQFEAKKSRARGDLNARTDGMKAQLDLEYREVIQKLTEQIDDAASNERVLSNSLARELEKAEGAAGQEVRAFQRTRLIEEDRLRAIREEKETQLAELTAAADSDITSFKNSNQQKLGVAMTEYDDLERAHASEITAIMIQFDNQQQKLAELHRAAIEERDRERAEALHALQKAHEQRRQAILDQIQNRMRDEGERELRESLRISEDQHMEEVESVKDVLQMMASRMQELQEKIAQLQIEQTEARAMLAGQEEDQKLRRQEALDASLEVLRQARERHLGEVEEIDRRKEIVLREADKINGEIQLLNDSLQVKMTQLEFQYGMSGRQLKSGVEQFEVQGRRLNNKIDIQKLKMQEVDHSTAERQQETQRLEDGFDTTREGYVKEVQEEMEATLRLVKSEPADVFDEIRSLKKALTAELEDLMRDIEAAKAKTIRITDRLMMERAHLLDEMELQLRVEFEERSRSLTVQCERRMEVMNADFSEADNVHRHQMVQLKLTIDKRAKMTRDEFLAQIDELQSQKECLIREQHTLDESIASLMHRECPMCGEKRKLLNMFKTNEGHLCAQIRSLRIQGGKSDEMMDKIFVDPTAKKRRAKSLIDVPIMPTIRKPDLTKSHRPVVFKL
jgi:hypothetical protein